MIGREVRIPDAPEGSGVLYDRSYSSGFFGGGGGWTGWIVPPVPVVGLRTPDAGSVPRAVLAPDGEPGTSVFGDTPGPRVPSFARIAEFRLREPGA
jgi:hypothetical protein